MHVLAPLVDTRAQVWRRVVPMFPIAPDCFDIDATPESYIRELDRAGVRYGVVSSPRSTGDGHGQMIEILQAYDRLRGTATVDPGIGVGRLRELDRAGVVGIDIVAGHSALAPNLFSTAYRDVLRAVGSLDWHVHISGWNKRTPEILATLNLAEVKIVIDHFGVFDDAPGVRSETFEAILSSIETGRTWIRLSSPYPSKTVDDCHHAGQLLAEVGTNRLLWGSDWPFPNVNGAHCYRQSLEWLAQWVPDESIRRQIDLNSASLYRFPCGAS